MRIIKSIWNWSFSNRGSTYWQQGMRVGIVLVATAYIFSYILAWILQIYLDGNIYHGILHENTNLLIHLIDFLFGDIVGLSALYECVEWVPCNFTYLGFLTLFFFSIFTGAYIGAIFDIVKRRIFIPTSIILVCGTLFFTYLMLSHALETPTRCNLMYEGTHAAGKSLCLANYVIYTQGVINPTHCEEMQETWLYLRSKCYMTIAKRTLDVTYCDKLSNESPEIYKKSKCYDAVQEHTDKLSDMASYDNIFTLNIPLLKLDHRNGLFSTLKYNPKAYASEALRINNEFIASFKLYSNHIGIDWVKDAGLHSPPTQSVLRNKVEIGSYRYAKIEYSEHTIYIANLPEHRLIIAKSTHQSNRMDINEFENILQSLKINMK